MSSELSAWTGPWGGRPPGRTLATVYFAAVFHLLGYKTVRTEPWGPEGQSHHSPPTYLHTHTQDYAHAVTH